MEDYRWNHHVPTFGRWDYGDDDDLPYTQCFESPRQAGFVRYGSYSEAENRDLYVAGDLYQNDVVTPTVIFVPRRTRKGSLGYPNMKEGKKQQKQDWGYSYDVKARTPKPIDEDLYKVPTEFLHVKPRRKRGLGLFSSCLLSTCV